MSFSLVSFGVHGPMFPCLFLGRERKSKNTNIFSVQSFILFLTVHSDSPCSCCNQVADCGKHTLKASFSMVLVCMVEECGQETIRGDVFSLGVLHMELGRGCYLQN